MEGTKVLLQHCQYLSFYAVNNGNFTLFWDSRWNGHVPLKFIYPKLFSLAKYKKWSLAKMISSYQTREVDLFYPNPSLFSLLLLQMSGVINSIHLSHVKDSISWHLTQSNAFSIKSCYEALNDGTFHSPFKTMIWKSTVPLKMKIFIWLALKDKILSHANLAKRG